MTTVKQQTSKRYFLQFLVSQVRLCLLPVAFIKRHSHHAWRQGICSKVRAVILIGEAADLIEKDLDGLVPCIRKTQADAVMQANRQQKNQDTVLYLPGCSSFDMFTGYKDRRQQVSGSGELLRLWKEIQAEALLIFFAPFKNWPAQTALGRFEPGQFLKSAKKS